MRPSAQKIKQNKKYVEQAGKQGHKRSRANADSRNALRAVPSVLKTNSYDDWYCQYHIIIFVLVVHQERRQDVGANADGRKNLRGRTHTCCMRKDNSVIS